MNATEIVYTVRDSSSGEYIRTDGTRTPTSDQAHEYATYAEAKAAFQRTTDRVQTKLSNTTRAATDPSI